jgi:O-antigen/teichoic acid export membrane protein
MGIVIRNSAWNLVITAVGFVLGALNVLILATTYLEDQYYGLWGYVLSMGFLLFPFMSFGIHNTIVKFHSSFDDKEKRDAFLIKMLVWPLLAIVPLTVGFWLLEEPITLVLAQKNAIVGAFLWHILAIAIFEAYFEIFYAWTKVHMKTIGGNFLKEVFYRAGATISLLLLAAGIIDQVAFINSLVVIYGLRLLVMCYLALRTYMPKFLWQPVAQKRELITYSLLMIIAGSVSTALLDLDKAMINNYEILDQISYYNVAVFIAAVIAVPARGMAQIMHPLTAGYLNSNNMEALEKLYKRSSLNLSIISGFLLVIIVCNVHEFYTFLPPEFAVAIPVVFFIVAVKYAESLLGNNSAILYNSNLYKVTLWLGLALTVIAVVLNMLLIPKYGINGAAVATCAAYLSYGFIKAWYVHRQMGIHPWTEETWKSIALIIIFVQSFYFWNFPWNPAVNITLKSTLITVFYALVVYNSNVSKELNALVDKRLNK